MKAGMDCSINKSLFELACHYNREVSQKLEPLMIKNCNLCFFFYCTGERLTCILFQSQP